MSGSTSSGRGPNCETDAKGHIRTHAVQQTLAASAPYAITAKRRLAAAPDIPTADEAGLPGFCFSRWHALWVPNGTPKDVVTKLNGAVVDALADANVRARLADLGQEIFPRGQQTPKALATFQKAERNGGPSSRPRTSSRNNRTSGFAKLAMDDEVRAMSEPGSCRGSVCQRGPIAARAAIDGSKFKAVNALLAIRTLDEAPHPDPSANPAGIIPRESPRPDRFYTTKTRWTCQFLVSRLPTPERPSWAAAGEGGVMTPSTRPHS
jgi:hypothetical protein